MVSVVLITHNRVNQLKKAVSSVLKQTYDSFELIIVNDNSTDSTSKYLETLNGHNRIKTINIDPEESNGGNHARNVGILASNGQYLAFLDDDDLWRPEKLETQARFLDTHNDYGMVYCGHADLYPNGKIKDCKSQCKRDGDLSEFCFTKTICTSSAMMVRRSILKEVGLFDEKLRFWQDFELIIRIANATKIGFIDKDHMIYNIGTNDKAKLTNKYNGWWNAIKYIKRKHAHLFNELPDYIKSDWRYMIYKEAARRAKMCGLDKEQRKYRKFAFDEKKRPVDLIRLILNY